MPFSKHKNKNYTSVDNQEPTINDCLREARGDLKQQALPDKALPIASTFL